MASAVFQRFLMQQMSNAQKKRDQAAQTKQISEIGQSLYGQRKDLAPFENDQMFPGEVPIKGLQQGQVATGLFDTDMPIDQRILELNQRRNESGIPLLQDRAGESMKALEANMLQEAGSAGIQRERYNPTSKVSSDARDRAKELFPDVNFDGLSAVDVMNIMRTLQAGQRIDNKVVADDKAAKDRIELEVFKTRDNIRKSANQKLLTVYGEELDQSRKFKPTLDTTNRIIELGKKVETGKIVGSAPAVWLRTMFGNNELQELESLIKGLPLPILKATFGAAFSVKEGETLATSLANTGMDAKAFQNSMNRLKTKLVYDERRFKSKKRYFDKNAGDLMGYKDNIPYPKSLDNIDVESSGSTGKTLSWGDM